VVGSFPVLLVGCGVGGESPSSIARTYEQAVVSHDGARLCATFAPKMREVIAEQVTQQQTTAAAGKADFDCGAFYNVLLGYPHENIDRKFIGGKLLGIGRARFVRRKGVLYARVPAKVKLDYVYTGYTIDRRREKGTTRFEDVVWLSKTAGAWRVVKPSLGLVAATGSPDVLGEQYLVAHVDAPPPDPDYSLNRAERIRAEAADYRASFRRPISHTALRCMDKGLSVSDRLGDAVTYRPQSPGLPAAAPAADDIERVNVRAAGHIICVAVTFAKKPSGQLSIGFTPHWRKTFFGTYIVEIKPGLGVRGGGLTTSYRYFRAVTASIRDWSRRSRSMGQPSRSRPTRLSAGHHPRRFRPTTSARCTGKSVRAREREWMRYRTNGTASTS
jgi:hypothetical protein